MTEETLARELERRADDVHAAPLTLDAVAGRARRIRRRRRTAVAAGVAALVIVAVAPFVVTAGREDSAPDPAPAPVGPGASVLHDGTLTRPDGTTVPIDVDNADVTQMAVLADGRTVLATQEPYGLRVHAPDGRLEASYPVRYNVFTTSADGSAVAWVARDRSVQVLSSGAAEPVAWPRIPTVNGTEGNISAVLDAGRLLVDDGTATVLEMTPDGATDLVTPEPLRVVDVSPDGSLWSVDFVATGDAQYPCSGLYDPEAGAVVARTCDSSGLRFSPDGRHLLGARGDNNMAGEASAYDLDLQPLGSYEASNDGEAVSSVGWADADHLLLAMANWRTSEWRLDRVRVGDDWTDVETLVPPSAGRNPEIVHEFVLSQ